MVWTEGRGREAAKPFCTLIDDTARPSPRQRGEGSHEQSEDSSVPGSAAQELQAAASCRPGSCSLKVTADEIARLREASNGAEEDRDARLQRAFRQIVLARATAYLTLGRHDLAPLINRTKSPGTESFLYWSLETYGSGRPVALVTHVNIVAPVAPADPAIVISQPVFATHYVTGGLAVTAITTDRDSGARYLVYRNSTAVDLLGGVLGPIRRAILQSRLKREVPAIIQGLRERLERTSREPAPRPPGAP